ncbi:actin-related protein 9 [Punica granatum]|uniref:Uncharacterized protein n=2 Tax=Punica granatum TaxID=22663 RepID=A0A2I0IJG7_PUNGR|nr:actin-related protein 9 [Punica granatum]PKI44145.1 hypothetical protein CRG98_035489 [Punica granatum]
MDYLKTVVPSQLIAERGANIVVINPGSASIRIGLASQDTPYNLPHCIARYSTQQPKRNVQDQMLNSQITTAQHMEREHAYDIIASLLKIPFLDEEAANNNSFSRKMARVDGYNLQTAKKDTPFAWADVYEKSSESFMNKGSPTTSYEKHETVGPEESSSSEQRNYQKYICGEEALRISPSEPYCLHRPIRRGHFNVSQHYPVQQVYEDLCTIWDWIMMEKLHIAPWERNLYSAILVVPETFDSREIKEMLTIVLQDLRFGSAVVHQEGLAAAFGNGLSTTCIVNIGAQTTSVVCIEDGVALPTTEKTLPFGGEDISRCLLWTQRHHQTWPQVRTDMLTKPVDLLMLNELKEMYCQITEGEVVAAAVVYSYEDDAPAASHKTRLTALNVPPMGLFYPMLLVPDIYPPPPRTWFKDYEDMLEETWNTDYARRPDIPDPFYLGANIGYSMWDSYPIFQTKPKKEEKIGLAEAIVNSILSTGRIELKRKLFCSIQLVGGVALTRGLIPAVEERVLHTIPSHEAIDTVEVLQPRANPTFAAWKGGMILGVLDVTRDAWIHRVDWINSGIHIGSGRKYKDSYYLQAQATAYINP